MFETVVEKIKIHTFMFGNIFPKIVPLKDNVEKYCGAGQATEQWVCENAIMLCYVYIACLVCKNFVCTIWWLN